MTGTWYPPTTYEPAAGSGQFLCNPPFMPDQDLIEAACHNACQAMHEESAAAYREQRTPETCLILAAALDVLLQPGISFEEMQEIAAHLRKSASPRRAA